MTALLLFAWIALIVAVALAILFGLIVLPVWVIVHCAISPRLSVKVKAIWIVVMVLCWPFGALAYGAFIADARILRWSSRITLALGIVGIVAMVAVMPWFLHRASDAIAQTVARLDRLELQELTAAERQRLREALGGLTDETRLRWSRLNQAIMATDLHELFDVMTIDRRLTHEEYDEWMTRYRLRGDLNRDALEDEIRRRRHASPAAASARTPQP